MAYDRTTVHAPRLAGLALSAVASLVDNKLSRALLTPRLLEGAGIAALRRTALDEAPAFEPPFLASPISPTTASLHARTVLADVESLAKPRPAPGYRFETIADFALAYREERITPEVVATHSTSDRDSICLSWPIWPIIATSVLMTG